MSTNRAITLTAIVLLLVAAWGYLFGHPPSPMPAQWELAPSSELPEDAVTVRYAGTATLLFSDGETAWMTDGWFSRPGLLDITLGSVAPDTEAVKWGLDKMGVTELAAVFPLHSHYDHAMDTPEVARRTGALVLGSESTANIARGWRLPESQIKVVENWVPIELGDFVITPIESRHFPFPDDAMAERLLADPEITAPLVPPVGAFDYRLGKAYILHVRHPQGSFLVVGSAGFVPGQLEGIDVDAVFLGIGGLGSQTPTYREQFWREVVEHTSPERVFPIHWDSLTAPLDGPLVGEARIMALLAKGEDDLVQFLEEKAAGDDAPAFAILPRFQPVVLFR